MTLNWLYQIEFMMQRQPSIYEPWLTIELRGEVELEAVNELRCHHSKAQLTSPTLNHLPDRHHQSRNSDSLCARTFRRVTFVYRSTVACDRRCRTL